jgi:8-oxo-dGTP pyrophosphatase MutT (NUDIX family)
MSPDTSAAVDHLRETLVERRTVFTGRLLSLHDDVVALPSGSQAGREVIHHPGAVVVVAVTGDGRIVLVRQWRHAVGGALWELPAGTRDAGEAAATTAARELREETGYAAGRWSALGEAYVSPGYSRELLSFFLAEELNIGDASAAEDELLDVRLFQPAEVTALVRQGMTDCKTVGGLALAGRLPAVPWTQG